MRNTKVSSENDFNTIVQIYNTSGKTEAHRYIQETFGIRNPSCVIKRIKQSKGYIYDSEKDTFISSVSAESESLFMSIDELCLSKPASIKTEPEHRETNRKMALESIIKDLISDRLLELSKYVILDSLERTIIVDKSSMMADGYNVKIH